MFRIVMGSCLALIGLAVFLVALVAFVDPVGTKMADDGDPFGPPPSRLESSVIALVGAGHFVFGGGLAFKTRKSAA